VWLAGSVIHPQAVALGKLSRILTPCHLIVAHGCPHAPASLLFIFNCRASLPPNRARFSSWKE